MPRIPKTPPVEMRCPYCNAQGIRQVEAKTVGFFAIIYCRQCGAIHGAIPRPTETPKQVEPPKPEIVTPPAPPPFDIRKIKVESTEDDTRRGQLFKPVEPTPPPEPQKKEPEVTPERAHAMMTHYVQPGSTMYKIIRKDEEKS